MCRSCFSILACITVCTFRVNKAEGWCLIYRAQSGSVECGANPATRPVYETTSPPCLFHVENTNCTVCHSVGTASLCNTNSQSLNFASSDAGTSVWFYLKEPSLRTLVCSCLPVCLLVQYFTLYLWHVSTYGVNSYHV